MNVTLNVNGQERTFTEQELTSILEEYFSNKNTSNRTTNISEFYPPTGGYGLLSKGEWFEVDPKSIRRHLFIQQVEEPDENARKIIYEAFKEMDNNPNKYARRFKIRIPFNDAGAYRGKRFSQIMESLSEMNQHIADWVEIALVWAQRISNGETWERLRLNVSLYERVIIGKTGKIACLGGATIPFPRDHLEYDFFETPLSFDAINRVSAPVIVSYDI